MSAHIFRQKVGTIEFEVQIGWDKPLQQLYFVISPVIQSGEYSGQLDDAIASNLDLKDPKSLTLKGIQEFCDDCGLRLPEGLLDAVEADQMNDISNREVRY